MAFVTHVLLSMRPAIACSDADGIRANKTVMSTSGIAKEFDQ
ncbi:hypothetical protein [Caballeronia calidae]|nr:hypothetical protein [Caballeronia calidae]